jgi:5-formyltetrahydrofolate cyclo-ligase
LDEREFTQRNNALLERLITWLDTVDRSVIHIFLPIEKNKEPDLRPLLKSLWQRGYQLMVSSTDFEKRTLSHYHLEQTTRFEKNTMGIPEAINGNQADFADVDLVLVPLVAADGKMNRIGYGGGFYDRLLAETKATKVGLNLAPLVDELFHTDHWDVPLDLIITPKQTWQKQHLEETKRTQ